MKSYVHLLTAACLFAGGAMLTSPAMGEGVSVEKKVTVKTDTDKKTLAFPQGITQKDLTTLGAVEIALTNMSENAFAKNGFDNLISYLVDQDRKRMADKKNMHVDDLNGLAEKINGTWKAKYGQNFKADRKAFDNFAVIITGEVDNADHLVGKWPVDAGPMLMGKGEGKLTASDAGEAKGLLGGNVNLEKGRNVALVHFPASHGLPAITASMINEATGWRFDIPNNITADHLHGNVKNALTTLANKTDWPADFYEAQRLATHHIVGALYGVDMTVKDLKTVTDK